MTHINRGLQHERPISLKCQTFRIAQTGVQLEVIRPTSVDLKGPILERIYSATTSSIVRGTKILYKLRKRLKIRAP